jgi:hypothetical protein
MFSATAARISACKRLFVDAVALTISMARLTLRSRLELNCREG